MLALRRRAGAGRAAAAEHQAASELPRTSKIVQDAQLECKCCPRQCAQPAGRGAAGLERRSCRAPARRPLTAPGARDLRGARVRLALVPTDTAKGRHCLVLSRIRGIAPTSARARALGREYYASDRWPTNNDCAEDQEQGRTAGRSPDSFLQIPTQSMARRPRSLHAGERSRPLQ